MERYAYKLCDIILLQLGLVISDFIMGETENPEFHVFCILRSSRIPYSWVLFCEITLTSETMSRKHDSQMSRKHCQKHNLDIWDLDILIRLQFWEYMSRRILNFWNTRIFMFVLWKVWLCLILEFYNLGSSEIYTS